MKEKREWHLEYNEGRTVQVIYGTMDKSGYMNFLFKFGMKGCQFAKVFFSLQKKKQVPQIEQVSYYVVRSLIHFLCN